MTTLLKTVDSFLKREKNNKPHKNFEDFIAELAFNLDLSLQPNSYEKTNSTWVQTSRIPDGKVSKGITILEISNLYPTLIYNKYSTSDIPIMTLFGYIYNEFTSKNYGEHFDFIRMILNFFYGYSVSNTRKYSIPDLTIPVSDFFNSIPSEVIAYDTDRLFVYDINLVEHFLNSFNLKINRSDTTDFSRDFLNRPVDVYFISKSSKNYLVYSPETNKIFDRTKFKQI